MHPHDLLEARPEDDTQDLDQADLDRLAERHHEQVVCTRCHEWTEYGESCCGRTECEPGCPECEE